MATHDDSDISEPCEAAFTDSQIPDNCSETLQFHAKNSESDSNAESLQGAFKKFLKKRKNELKEQRIMEKKALLLKLETANPAHLKMLRMKFLEGCISYMGVPYTRKVHPEGSELRNAPMELDCCALIRKVLRNMRKELGFRIGPWNQAYQYDTLPDEIREEEMQPGDLVFLSGVYYNKKKQQKHHMCHVEVWLGEGEAVVGSRWKNGVVQRFLSYKFTPTSYRALRYHFKSIDAWMMGVCKSYCGQHSWGRRSHKFGKKSIFNSQEDEGDEAADAEPDSGTDEEPIKMGSGTD